jgi:thiol-disulfide isomerase/thioredoxin
MRAISLLLGAAILLSVGPAAAQKSGAPSPAADASAEAALDKVFAASGNNRAELVRNLKQYLLEYPNSPRKPAIYRALVEACQQLQDDACALSYAERLIALEPDDSDMMLIAVDYLQGKADDPSLTRAAGYLTRVLDRVEKLPPDERPAGESLPRWEAKQNDLRSVLYYGRGQIEYSQQHYDDAAKDLQISYTMHPTALAAEKLGEIAELEGDSRKAIEEYTRAFVAPDSGPGPKPDRHEIREQLGNVWRAVHGSEQGLGDAILAAYDQLAPSAATPSAAATNQNAKDPFAFVVRRLDGTPMALSVLKGKVMVLSFWATWSPPSVALERTVKDVAQAWSGESRVNFLEVNTDRDESLVPEFVKREKWDLPAVYADGIDRFLKVRTLPTVLVVDPTGRVTYRVEGFSLPGFEAALSAAIQNAVGNPG